MLERAHRTGIYVDVGVEFEQCDFEASGFKHCSKGGSGDTFPQRGNNTTGNKYVSRHGLHQSNWNCGAANKALPIA